MGVLSKISVGDILYYHVDDIPTHSAPKGSVSIYTPLDNFYDNQIQLVYINNDGNNTWLKSISSGHGEIYRYDSTTVIDYDTLIELTVWYEITSDWVVGDFVGDFVFDGVNEIVYTGETPIKIITKQTNTIRSGSNKWMTFGVGVLEEFAGFGRDLALNYNYSYIRTGGVYGNISNHLLSSVLKNESVLAGLQLRGRESAGGGPTTREFEPRHYQLKTIKIDEGFKKTIFNEDFESSGFTENSWTVVNDAVNVWVVGQAENNGGTSSAYVSDDSGVSASYTITTADVSHFYKDFTIPSNVDSVLLEFDWKCQGENAAGVTQYDYGCVIIADTGTTPVAGTEVVTTQADNGGNGRVGAFSNLGKFNLNYGTNPGTTWNKEYINLTNYTGQTKRIIFTWKNDGSVGTDPPFIIDNIKISEITF